MKPQVELSHYEFLSYIDIDRFSSYYYQLKYILEIEPDSFLEIGGGIGVLKKLLPDNIKYYNLDINKGLNPDIIGNIEKLPVKDNKFEIVGCFQVLEHLPFEKFLHLLEELKRISSKYIFISLPFANHKIMADLFLPKIKKKTFRLLVPKFYQTHKFDGQHFWEIGKKNYSFKKIYKLIEEKFKVVESFTPDENTYHQFFLLKKK